METIAVYWESKVKVYSITHVTDLSLINLAFPIKATEELGKALMDLEDSVQRFELVTQDYVNSTLCQMNLFYDQSKQENAEKRMRKWAEKMQATVTSVSHLELIYLHGPHFQERFGIVDIVFSAFKDDNIKIITAGCAGTTIYLAVPDKTAVPATRILRQKFIIPATV
ncbi:MAG: hypothetical protein KAI39_02325 [Desulfobulbaceae bacterium]|nr:hypothetical protein [Desulfobulbaceae bacterium]